VQEQDASLLAGGGDGPGPVDREDDDAAGIRDLVETG
jgi:hypothetical protein